MIYACAAVSDFFIPHNKMTEHKIQVENLIALREVHRRANAQTPVAKRIVHLTDCPMAERETRC